MSKQARYLTYFVFFYTCIEGLVINLTYPDRLPFVYKDLAIVAIYILVFLSRSNRTFLRAPIINRMSFPLVLFAIVLILYLATFETNVLVGLFAIKQRLFYIPLVAVGYLLVRSETDLKRFLIPLMIYASAVSAFGIYLYFRGPEGLRDIGARYSAEVLTPHTAESTETYWRVPGTFNSPGQYGAYLQFNGLIAVALLMTHSLSKRMKLITAISLLLILSAILCSGSRASFAVLSASVAAMFVFSRKLSRVTVWSIFGYVILAFGFTFLGPGVQDRFASIATYENSERFQSTYFGQLFLPSLLENPLGSGLGIATIGARHLSGEDQSAERRGGTGDEYLLTESYFGILAIETGLLGFATFMWACIQIGTGVFSLRKAVADSTVAMPCYALIIYVLSTLFILPVSTAIDHAPMNTYFWFSIGVVAKVADLARMKRLVNQRVRHHRAVQQGSVAFR